VAWLKKNIDAFLKAVGLGTTLRFLDSTLGLHAGVGGWRTANTLNVFNLPERERERGGGGLQKCATACHSTAKHLPSGFTY
jgi:hypothetical protein